MERSDILKLDSEFEPFLVKEGDNEAQYYKERFDIDMVGKVTWRGKLKWLAFRNAITIDDLEKGSYRVRIDKRTDNVTSCKNYEKTVELMEAYLNAKFRLGVGKMGTKVTQNDINRPVNDIDGESIPF